MSYIPYQKYDWQTGEIVTEPKLDHMEDGLEAASAQVAENIEDITELKAEMPHKANTNGYYTEMSVGNSEQLISTVTLEDQTPYNFRTSGGSLEIGNREEVKKIIGGTVAWNQLVQAANDNTYTYGVTVTNNNDGSVTINGTNEASGTQNLYASSNLIPFISTHRYLVDIGDSTFNQDVRIGPYNAGISLLTLNNGAGIGSPSADGTNYLVLRIPTGQSFSNVKVFVKCYDLTQLFGTTIADYLYTLEQSTAGAGVALFRKLFPKTYYQSNAGSLESVQTSKHEMVGFNQWDEQWELGSIDPMTGENSSGTTTIRSTNYIPVIGGNSYYFYQLSNQQLFAFGYDANKNYIGIYANGEFKAISSGATNCRNSAVFIPSEIAYIRFRCNAGYGTTYQNDICINISHDGSRNGEYEPYQKYSYPLDSSVVLRGIPKQDASGNIYFDGDEYLPDGTVNRRYGLVDLGTLNWDYIESGDVPYFRSTTAISDMATSPHVICAKYVTATIAATGSASMQGIINASGDKSLVHGSGTYLRIGIRDSAYTDAAAFKTAMSGVYLVYELATPTTEQADPYQEVQIVSNFGTEQYVDAGERDVEIPVGNLTEYPQDLVAKIESVPNNPNSDGDYILHYENNTATYIPIMFPASDIPTPPSEDGAYSLVCTVVDGTAVFSWEVQ